VAFSTAKHPIFAILNRCSRMWSVVWERIHGGRVASTGLQLARMLMRTNRIEESQSPLRRRRSGWGIFRCRALGDLPQRSQPVTTRGSGNSSQPDHVRIFGDSHCRSLADAICMAIYQHANGEIAIARWCTPLILVPGRWRNKLCVGLKFLVAGGSE
jgi:hypothetical protein